MAEPVSLSLARAQCAILDGDTTWDVLLSAYISAAREWVERYTGVTLMSQTVTEYFDEFDDTITLSRWPVISITEIGYLDSEGVSATTEDFTLMNTVPATILPLDAWPDLGTNGEVIVEYVAGYAEGDEPTGLIQAMLLLIAHWFKNREGTVVGVVSNELHLAVTSLCERYRVQVA